LQIHHCTRIGQIENRWENAEKERKTPPSKQEEWVFGVALEANDKADGFTVHEGDYIRDSRSSFSPTSRRQNDSFPLRGGDIILMMFNP